MNHTFIKLYRDITEWQWYRDANTFRVYLHLMLLAEFRGGVRGEDTMEVGDVIIKTKTLCDDLGLTENQVRLALERLKSTGEITVGRVFHGLKIHLPYYSRPPCFAQSDCGPPADKPRSDHDQTTITPRSIINIKNAKNAKNAEREENSSCPPASIHPEEEDFSFPGDGEGLLLPVGSASEPEESEAGPEESEAAEQSVYPGENGNLRIDAEGLHRLRTALPDSWQEKAEYLSAYLAAHPEKQYADHVSIILLWARQDREKTVSRTAPDPWERINRLAHGQED